MAPPRTRGPRIDTLRRLDLRDLKGAGFVDRVKAGEDVTAHLRWPNSNNEESVIVSYFADEPFSIIVQTAIAMVVVDLDWKGQRLGGHRLWIRCPQCKRRCRLLCMDRWGASIACRVCHDAPYPSQSCDGIDAARKAFRRAHYALGGKTLTWVGLGNIPDEPPTRPRYMHMPTYDRLCERWWHAKERFWHATIIHLRSTKYGQETLAMAHADLLAIFDG